MTGESNLRQATTLVVLEVEVVQVPPLTREAHPCVFVLAFDCLLACVCVQGCVLDVLLCVRLCVCVCVFVLD